ncbi:hypothetical protein VKT23_018756 [Stygiomarasmius scandens]|uniref:Cytochrome P450 n=1 Tax=Marasmiellus scandens TaxID=2682957 RepID=A0ABR1IPV3_9AGAR
MSWEILAATISCLLFLYLVRSRNKVPYPPGPRGIPFLGNILQINPQKPWETFAEWRRTYGPVVFISLAGRPALILNTKEAAEDLLVRKAAIYSDRPRFVVSSETSGNLNMPTAPYTEMWRRMRRATEHALSPKAITIYHQHQTNESVVLTHSLLNDPSSWRFQAERASSSVALSLLYDTPLVQSLDDPSVVFVNNFLDKMDSAQALPPNGYLVDVFPTLGYLPRFLLSWRRQAETTFKTANAWFEKRFLDIKDQVINGQEQRPSFCVTLAENQNIHKMSDQHSAWLAGSLYIAASETTATTMKWFIFTMILYPEVQKRAQDELDKIVGRSRLPSFADAKHLPYIQAIVKEILRWRPGMGASVPHAPTQDDYYKGYFIPKGTLVLADVWGINCDPEIYGPDADKFHPERHLDTNGNLKDDSPSEGHVTYGFGHRICAGRYVANNTMFIEIAMILWATKLEPVKSRNGNFVMPDVNGVDGGRFFVRPPPFEFVTTPRFEDVDTLIQQARDEVMQEVDARKEAQ